MKGRSVLKWTISASFPFLLIIFLAILTERPIFGVEQTGIIKGVVVDQDGVPLSGIEVEIESPAMQGKRSFLTNEKGEFRFFSLPPGLYSVIVEHPGYIKTVLVNQIVSIGRTTAIQITLQVPEAGEYIEVTEVRDRPAVDPEKTRLGETLSDTFIQDIPMEGRDYQTAMSFLPGVVGAGNAHIHGALDQNNQFYLDGVNITDPMTNTFSLNFNFDAIADIEVATGGYEAEYGQALGGIVNIVTKSGGNKLEGDISFYYRDTAMRLVREEDLLPGDEDLIFSTYTTNINIGGPILKDKLWYFLSVEYGYSQETTTVDPEVGRDVELYPMQPRIFNHYYYLGKLTYQPNPSHKFSLLGQADPTYISNTEQSGYVLPQAEGHQDQGGAVGSFTWDWTISPNLLSKLQIYGQWSYISVYPQMWWEMNKNPDNPFLEGYDPNSSAYGCINYGFDYGNFPYWVRTDRYRFSANWKLTYFLDNFLGSHEFKGGLSFDRLLDWTSYNYIGGKYYRVYATGDANDLSSYLPYDYIDTGEEGVAINEDGYITSAFVQDSWKPFTNVTAKPGIRFDHSRIENDVGNDVIDFFLFSPRFGVSWDPWKDNKTNIHAHYGRFLDTGFLYIASFVNRRDLTYNYYAYNSRTGDYDTTPYLTSVGGSYFYADLVAPHVDEYIAGIDREIQKDLNIGLNFIYKEGKNLFEDDEIIVVWDEEGKNAIGWRDPDSIGGYAYRLRTPDEVGFEYRGVEFTIKKTLTENWQFLGSYTWSRTEGNIGEYISYTLDNPVESTLRWGYLPHDRTHMIKVVGSYHAPLDVKVSEKFGFGYTLGFDFRFYSGSPYNKISWNNYQSGYVDYEEQRGLNYRLPALSVLDLKAVFAVTFFETQFDVIFDIFNVFNTREVIWVYTTYRGPDGEVVVDEDGDPLFGQPMARYQPRTFRLGFRYRF